MKEEAKLLETGQVIIDARKDPGWFEKAKDALAKLRPIKLRGNEEQIVKFLKYKHGKAGKWKTEGMLTIEPPIEF
jgi:hypothetical protein